MKDYIIDISNPKYIMLMRSLDEKKAELEGKQ